MAQNCRCVEESCRTSTVDRFSVLGEWQQLKLHCFKLCLLLKVDKYESLNAVYQSEGHPVFMIFSCFRILQQSLWSMRQYHVQNITFSSPSLLKSHYVCSQCKRGRRIWVYKEVIQHRARTNTGTMQTQW